MVIRKLTTSNLKAHKIRVVLTVLAVALAVSLVVSVTSGYRSVIAAAEKFMDQYLGATDAQITQKEDNRAGVPQKLVEDLEADPRVRRATGRLETTTRLLDKNKKPVPKHADVFGVVRSRDERVEHLRISQGRWFEDNERDVAVVDEGVAKTLQLKVGDTFYLPGLNGMLSLTVTGLVHKPGFFTGHIQTIYVPLPILQKFIAPDQKPYVSRVMIGLNPKVDSEQFGAEWKARLAQSNPTLRFRLTRDSRKDLDRNLQGIQILSLMGAMVSMLAATFIIFSSLSMGVAERQRTLAMLRAIGAYRIQIARMVMLEGVLLAGIGSIVGVPLGLFWVRLLAWKYPAFFVAGVVVSLGGVALGVGVSMLAALGASLLPAWTATRVSPLDAMNPLSTAPKQGLPYKSALAGLVLAALDPLIMFSPWGKLLAQFHVNEPDAHGRLVSFYGHFVLGIPSLMLGFFLLSPLFVVVIERLLSSFVAWAFQIRPTLLRQQLSTGLWRAAGTCSSMMVGLAILVVMQTQGQTLLNGWQLPDKFPDIFIYSKTAMSLDDMPKIQDVPGNHGVCTIMVIAQAGLIGTAMTSPVDISYLADNVILLRYFESSGEICKAISVVKKRSGRHETSIREYNLDSNGVKVGPALTRFRGILTGVPTLLPSLEQLEQ